MEEIKLEYGKGIDDRIVTYVNHHSFKSELAKYDIIEYGTQNKGEGYWKTGAKPCLQICRMSKDAAKLAAHYIGLETGASGYRSNPTVLAQYTKGDYTYCLVPMLDLVNMIKYDSVYNNVGPSYNRIVPYSVLGYSMRDIIVKMFNNLGTLTTTKSLSLGTKALAILSDEDKKIATDKGWTLA